MKPDQGGIYVEVRGVDTGGNFRIERHNIGELVGLFTTFRIGLRDHAALKQQRHTDIALSLLVEALGRVIAERDALRDLLEAAYKERDGAIAAWDAAEIRIDELEALEKMSRAILSDPNGKDRQTKAKWLGPLAAAVAAALIGLGGTYVGSQISADGSRDSARVAATAAADVSHDSDRASIESTLIARQDVNPFAQVADVKRLADQLTESCSASAP